MKFGKSLLRSQIEEWSWNYLSYKSLKGNISAVVESQRKGEPTETVENKATEFFFALDRELEKVNTFFLYKKAEMDRRIRILVDKHRTVMSLPLAPLTPAVGTPMLTVPSGDSAAIETALISSLVDTKDKLHKILRFAEMNRSGFRKILKKFDKKTGRSTQDVYMKKVLLQPFADPLHFDEMLESIEKLIRDIQTRIEDLKHSTDFVSTTSSVKRMVNLLTPDINARLSELLKVDDAVNFCGLLVDMHFVQPNGKVFRESSAGIAIFNDTQQPAVQSNSDLVNINRTLAVILYKACRNNAVKCVHALFAAGIDLSGHSDVDERSFLHKVVLAGGKLDLIHRLSLEARSITRLAVLSGPGTNLISDDSELLREFLKSYPAARNYLLESDIYGRIPLHYAAINGCAGICKVLVEAVHDEFNGNATASNYGSAWVDHEGHSPFFYAVLRGHTEVVEVLLRIKHVNVDSLTIVALDTPMHFTPSVVASALGSLANSPNFANFPGKTYSQNQTPLSISSKLGHTDLVKLLIAHGANVNFVDEDGESPLHLAARNGHASCISALTEDKNNCASLEGKEHAYSWTPLYLAAVEGHVSCVETLLKAGATADLVDAAGWTPHEHAVFRGHMEIANLLRPLSTMKLVMPPTPMSSPNQTSPLTPPGVDNDLLMNPDRSYGHNYLKNRSMIMLTLGSNDTRFKNTPLELFQEQIPTYPSLSLIVSALNATGEPVTVDLPSKESFEPIIFYTLDDTAGTGDKVILQFDVQPTFGTHKSIIGRATAILSSLKQLVGKKDLSGVISIPVIGKGFEIIGIVHFEYLIIEPFSHGNLSIGSKRTYWKSVETKVIGHRGSGANKPIAGGGNLQIGENTVLSLVTAASLGAEYVEFDVQVTKDFTPVIYHDWILSETGMNIPVDAATLEEFQNLGPRGRAGRRKSITRQGSVKLRKSTSLSDEEPTTANPEDQDANAYVAPRRKNSKKMFDFVRAPFATLKELFQHVPPNTGFNIEVKYPHALEREQYGLSPVEMNKFIDCVLQCVYDNAGDRSIIFSSFNPDACLMLNLKQPNYPVFLLTDSGMEKIYDARGNSLQESIRFAKFADLLGIVSVCDPLIEAPHLCSAVKENGLLLFSYGAKNNEVKNFEIQRKFGVDAVIVDKIVPIVGSLKMKR